MSDVYEATVAMEDIMNYGAVLSGSTHGAKLERKFVDQICKFGQGRSCCSYLLYGKHFECAKGTEYESMLKQRLAGKLLISLGDNCDGPPLFTIKATG